jgi:hypothetical protein
MTSAAAVQLVWYCNIGATFLLIIRLRTSGLNRIYRAFSWYLLESLLQDALALVVRSPFRRTVDLYMAGQTVKLILTVFVVMELYHFALAGQPALARYGRSSVGAALAFCALASTLVVTLLPVVGYIKPGNSPVLYYFYAFERTMDSAVLFFLFLASAFLAWFPVRVPKNVAIYMGGFVAYFLTRWAALFWIVISHRYLNLANFIMMSIAFICLTAWIVSLRKEGEKTSTVTGHRWNPGQADRLMGQLIAINAKLERFSAKSGKREKYIPLHS